MSVSTLSAAEVQQLNEGLRKLAPAGATAESIDLGAAASGAKEEFCSLWPKVRPILELVAKYIVFIPGAGPAAAAALKALLVVGDSLSGAICGARG